MLRETANTATIYSAWIPFVSECLFSYAMMIGVILSVIVGINATKIITEKRLEFFREAASGISVGAFYAAANITNTFEQGLSVIIAAGEL